MDSLALTWALRGLTQDALVSRWDVREQASNSLSLLWSTESLIVIITPDERGIHVAFEDRGYSIPYEDRGLVVVAENRGLFVEEKSIETFVPAEDRGLFVIQ